VTPDAIVVGSGPNGLAAAITMARAGRSVVVYEAEATVGGGMRSAELTLPRFVHDVCSAIHPTAVASPFFRSIPGSESGIEWVHPEAPLAHPLDDGTAVVVERSLEDTARGLGPDEAAYHKLVSPFVRRWDTLAAAVMAPLVPPKHPVLMARFGLQGLRSAEGLARKVFRGVRARALFAGLAAHSMQPLDALVTASFGLTLACTAHACGWPMAKGGSQRIADGLVRYLESLGGTIVRGRRVVSIGELSAARVVLLDVSPRQLVAIAGERLPSGYARRLSRYRHGPAVFKVDWALEGAIPWTARECARAGTVHLGGTLEQIAASEAAVARGGVSKAPFVLLAQQSLFDASRAPAGKHTAWAYCHVPNGFAEDVTERIEAQVERFAPGFSKRILKRHVMSPAAFEAHDANYVGGDIVGGANTLRQMIARPVFGLNPYAIPVNGWYLCSASTPPGGGVHGMCGYHAAKAALA